MMQQDRGGEVLVNPVSNVARPQRSGRHGPRSSRGTSGFARRYVKKERPTAGHTPGDITLVVAGDIKPDTSPRPRPAGTDARPATKETIYAPIPLAEIPAMLEHFREQGGGERVGNQIASYLGVRAEEADDESPLVPASMRSMLTFIRGFPSLSSFAVGATPHGLMALEWRLADTGDSGSHWGRGAGVVSLIFLESGLVQYVAVSGPHRGAERIEAQGVTRREYLAPALGEFGARIAISGH